MNVTTSDGVSLNVLDEGTGPAVVLLGGYGMPATAWGLQVEVLRDSHRVVSIDRRSHGESERPSFGHRMARHGKDLEDVLAALDLQDVLLVGASMGSNTVLAYCDLFSTTRLRGVVLVDQTPKMINEGNWQLGMYDLTRESLDAFITGFPGGLNPFHQVPAPEAMALMQGPAFSIEETRDLLRDHSEKDWRDVVERIDVPLLAIAGRHSPLWSWESSGWMADHARKGTLAVLEESGHVPFLEEPDAFNALLLDAAG
jgi:non-heme chloroperoxidase